MPPSAVDRCAEEIRQLLADGSYRPGDRLPAERQLANVLEVSRPALREAIRRLVAGGLLTVRRGSGTYVADVDLGEVFAIRVRLEPLAAELAARHRTAAEASRLRMLAKEMKHAMAEPARFAARDADAHELIATASRSRVLRDLLGRLGEQMRLSRSITSPSLGVRGATLRDISETAAAIAAQEPEKAARAMERHIRSVEEFSRAVHGEDAAQVTAAGEAV